LTLQVTSDEGVFDLQLRSGRVRCRRVGSASAPLVLCVHGLSAHMLAFDDIVDQVGREDRQWVMLDLRGRGHSEITRNGTYGLDAHARDLLEVATLLASERFELIGWSMGALIGLRVASFAPDRLRRLVMIDHAGRMDPGTVDSIIRALARLDMVMDDPSVYVEAMRSASGIAPWTPFWDRYFRYELARDPQGFKPRTSKSACLEDLAAVTSADWRASWRGIVMPALLVRCRVPLAGGFIVPEAERDALRRAVPQILIAESATNHYTVMNSNDTSGAIKDFLHLPS